MVRQMDPPSSRSYSARSEWHELVLGTFFTVNLSPAAGPAHDSLASAVLAREGGSEGSHRRTRRRAVHPPGPAFGQTLGPRESLRPPSPQPRHRTRATRT